jgi:hypothetical protein
VSLLKFYPREELERMRDAVAKESGITLYKSYGEEEAAHILGVDISTLKGWRRAGKVPFVNYGARKVRYLGIFLADIKLGLFNAALQQD